MTDRQAQILSLIVETYARTAEPVGSLSLADQIGASPATIRAEMGELEQNGFIRQPHTSAGRIPTDKGYRQYVNNLNPDPRNEQSGGRMSEIIERQIRDNSGAGEQAVKNAAQSLAWATRNLSIATWMDHIYQFGLPSLLQHPEFFGGQQAFEIARLVEQLPELLEQIYPDSSRVNVFIGSENPIGKSAGASSIIARIDTPYGRSFIGVIGPTRQNYGLVMSLVDHASRKLEEVLQ